MASAGELYQWFLNGVPLSGETSAELELNATGEYTVSVTSEYGCTAISAPYLYISTGLSEAAGLAFTMQPNPFTEQLRLDFGDPLPTGSYIELIDAQGHLVRTVPASGRSTVTLHREGLAAGVYLLRVAGMDATLSEQRVVVQ